MSSLQVKLPPDLVTYLKEAEDRSSVSKTLKEIHQSYDDLVKSLVSSHRPMLVQEISNLESLLTHPVDPFGNPIMWDDPKTLSSYTNKLKKTMDQLNQKHKQVSCSTIIYIVFLKLFKKIS